MIKKKKNTRKKREETERWREKGKEKGAHFKSPRRGWRGGSVVNSARCSSEVAHANLPTHVGTRTHTYTHGHIHKSRESVF